MPGDLTPQELAQRMEAAIRRMPPRTRTIFLAHRLDGLTYEEIGRRTGLTVHQVERHMASAITKLDREIERSPRRWWRFW